MVVFSTLRQQLRVTVNHLQQKKIFGTLVRRQMGGHGEHRMKIETCDWNWEKALDMTHLYVTIAVIIYGSIVLYANVFIGPATLAEIPEGYKPKHWEYYKHPISRAIQRYCFTDQQMEYEKVLHDLYLSDWNYKAQMLDEKVKYMMRKNQDYKAFYYRPISANILRYEEEDERNADARFGPNPVWDSSFPLDFKDDGDLPPPAEGY